MKVLIVSKTKMPNGPCIGAIAENEQSLRLTPSWNYQVGQIWDIDYTSKYREPPHTEDVDVKSKKYIKTLSVKEQIKAIESRMPPTIGGPQELYEGLLEIDRQGRRALYIAQKSGVPDYSTTFWRSDETLTRQKRDKEGRVSSFYRYPTEKGGCSFSFPGFQDPLEIIPANTLLRVSLAGWWSEEENVEKRCYAQLSGWYL